MTQLKQREGFSEELKASEELSLKLKDGLEEHEIEEH